jgi:hypothetical protein
MAEGLEAVCPCAHVLGSPRIDTACVIERCVCDDALYHDDDGACEVPPIPHSVRWRREKRLRSFTVEGGERRHPPHCYRTIRLWIRRILRGISCGACVVLGWTVVLAAAS